MLKLLFLLARISFMQSMRSRAYWSVSIGFITCTMALAVFGMGAQALGTVSVRVALVWLAAFLALLLHAPAAFAQNEEEGVLAHYQMLPITSVWLVFSQCTGSWVAIMLPVLLALMPAALLLQFSMQELWLVVRLLLPATWAFWMISACGSLLLLGNARAQGLHALIVLPLSIPVMIFGCAASSVQNGGDAAALLLLGLALAATVICPWLGAALLRMHRSL